MALRSKSLRTKVITVREGFRGTAARDAGDGGQPSSSGRQRVDVASAAGSSLLAIIAGAPLRIVFTTFDRPFYFLLSREDVREIKELKGKKIAFGGGIGSGFDTNLRVILVR
jgi:ABC-type nitrate/sulfonate/bicarbonate transport system substrate-binding protein